MRPLARLHSLQETRRARCANAQGTGLLLDAERLAQTGGSIGPGGACGALGSESQSSDRAEATRRTTTPRDRPTHPTAGAGDRVIEAPPKKTVHLARPAGRGAVALHVNLEKMPELGQKRDFHCLGCLGKSLLDGHSTMRTGRSYSPRTLVSNLIGLTTMPGRRRHVSERRM